MSAKYLAILEVSQKQAYIFSSNELRRIIDNSKSIAQITKWEFLEEIVSNNDTFNKAQNYVYEGGGHVILQFDDEKNAKDILSVITEKLLKTNLTMEVFVKLMPYDEEKTPAQNVRALTDALEAKKAKRRSSFHQGSFGIEKIDSKTLDPVWRSDEKLPEMKDGDKDYVPEGFGHTYQFKNLGGTENESNFIAVVHIDGNSMGERVDTFGDGITDWETYRTSMREFSLNIDRDFKDAYARMCDEVAEEILSPNSAISAALNLQESKEEKGKTYFPIRQIILAGDDVSFVAEGRIGIEAAVSFIKKITAKENRSDHKKYGVCAGVAIVHQNYPFYRAYELAEELCKNAKKFGAGLYKNLQEKYAQSELENCAKGAAISSIDWHIEYGEIKNTVEEIREDYHTYEQVEKYLELRPYIVDAPLIINEEEPIRQYENFRKLMKKIAEGDYGSGILKNLRGELKRGQAAADHYLRFHKITDLGKDLFYDIYQDTDYQHVEENIRSGKESDYVIFMPTADGKIRSTLFDGIEIMDTYLRIKEEQKR